MRENSGSALEYSASPGDKPGCTFCNTHPEIPAPNDQEVFIESLSEEKTLPEYLGKEVFDKIFAAAVLLLTLPLSIIAAISIKIDS